MFCYQTKINGHDGLVLVSETTDNAAQIPAIGKEVFVVYETEAGVFETAKGTLTDKGVFTPANSSDENMH